jgi:FkbM family methyltransferase
MARSAPAGGPVVEEELAMSHPELLESFQRDLRYKQASKWQKPWIDPGRFVRNQVRKHLYSRSQLGRLRVVRTFHCPEFTVVSGERVSEAIGSYGIYEESLTEAFLHLVEPGQVVVDIGMHIGYYTTLFACLVGPKGEVHAFEPTPSTREIAAHNLRRFPQVQVHPFAVWSSVGKLTFHDFGTEWMGWNSFTDPKAGEELPPAREFEVATITLDAFRSSLGKKIALLKIDAESAEEAILTGGPTLLAEDRPVISLEVGDVGTSANSRRPVDLLCSLGYRAWEFAGGRFVAHQPRASYSYDNLVFASRERELN